MAENFPNLGTYHIMEVFLLVRNIHANLKD